MYTIQTNASGTRSMQISEEHLNTIEKYALFQQLIDSTGIIDESVLDKLKLNIRSLLTSIDGDTKDLLDLCLDVIYHDNMKAWSAPAHHAVHQVGTRKRKHRRRNGRRSIKRSFRISYNHGLD